MESPGDALTLISSETGRLSSEQTAAPAVGPAIKMTADLPTALTGVPKETSREAPSVNDDRPVTSGDPPIGTERLSSSVRSARTYVLSL